MTCIASSSPTTPTELPCDAHDMTWHDWQALVESTVSRVTKVVVLAWQTIRVVWEELACKEMKPEVCRCLCLSVPRVWHLHVPNVPIIIIIIIIVVVMGVWLSMTVNKHTIRDLGVCMYVFVYVCVYIYIYIYIMSTYRHMYIRIHRRTFLYARVPILWSAQMHLRVALLLVKNSQPCKCISVCVPGSLENVCWRVVCKYHTSSSGWCSSKCACSQHAQWLYILGNLV